MTNLPAWEPRKGHGTEARARRHYRDGEKPCPACNLGRALARLRRGESKYVRK